MGLLIKNGFVIDSANKISEPRDILVSNGKIEKVDKKINNKTKNTINARGKIVIPGIFDMHVHLREPGREDKETVYTGTLAALAGGVTQVLAMPNTDPAIDSPENSEILKQIITKSANCNVSICAAITKKRQGEELVDFGKLKSNGVVAFSDDGNSVDNQEIMDEAFRHAAEHDLLIICHSEDKTLSKKGVVNYGFTSTRMGLRGVSNESEYKRISRDIELAKKHNARIHIAHVSCKESVGIIKKAKEQGVKVTCETAPHYFSLTEEDVLGYDTNKKMNPPLRSEQDKQAIIDGLKEGIIDVIASDHAPHTENEKNIEFDKAEFGVIGLQSILSVCTTELLHKHVLGWTDIVEKLCLAPARILDVDCGTLSVGKNADIAIVSPEQDWTLDKKQILSKSKNSAFLNKKLKGQVWCTIHNGQIVYMDKE